MFAFMMRTSRQHNAYFTRRQRKITDYCSPLQERRENFPEFQGREQDQVAQERFYEGECRDDQKLTSKLPRVLNQEPCWQWRHLAAHSIQVTVQKVQKPRHQKGKIFGQLWFLLCTCI